MFKDFSIFSSGGHLVYRSETILATLVGSHLGNISMKFESHWPKGSGGVSFLSKLFTIFYFKLRWPFCSLERNHFSYFGRGSPKQYSYEV